MSVRVLSLVVLLFAFRIAYIAPSTVLARSTNGRIGRLTEPVQLLSFYAFYIQEFGGKGAVQLEGIRILGGIFVEKIVASYRSRAFRSVKAEQRTTVRIREFART